MEKLNGLTSSVEFDSALQLDNGGGVALSGGGIELLESLVVIGDVSLVMLLVVELHDVGADGGLQVAVIVRQIGQRESVKGARGERSSGGEGFSGD